MKWKLDFSLLVLVHINRNNEDSYLGVAHKLGDFDDSFLRLRKKYIMAEPFYFLALAYFGSIPVLFCAAFKFWIASWFGMTWHQA